MHATHKLAAAVKSWSTALGVTLGLLSPRRLLPALRDGRGSIVRPALLALRLRRTKDSELLDELLLLLLDRRERVAAAAASALLHHRGALLFSVERLTAVVNYLSTDTAERAPLLLRFCNIFLNEEAPRHDLILALFEACGRATGGHDFIASVTAALLDRVADSSTIESVPLLQLLCRAPRYLLTVERHTAQVPRLSAALRRIAERLNARVRSGHLAPERLEEARNEIGFTLFQARGALGRYLTPVLAELQSVLSS